MTRSLPTNPSLTQLKKQAKALLKSHGGGDAGVCDTLRLLRRFESVSDDDVLTAGVGLQEVQHALAKDYGFRNWSDLRSQVGAGDNSGRGDVRRDNGKVWIEGVPSIANEDGGRNSFIASLCAVGSVLGEDMSFDYLLGASGAAFRLMFHQPGWCPSSADISCGFDHTPALTEASGRRMQCIQLFEEKNTPANREAARETLVRSIDAGLPVIGIDLRVCPEWGVVVGYSDDGRKLLCRTVFDDADTYMDAEGWPWILYVLEAKQPSGAGPAGPVEVVRGAVNLATTAAFGEYASGFAAFEAWVRALRDEEAIADADADKLKSICHANGWIYLNLLNNRAAAVRYLHAVASEFEDQAARGILAAAGSYSQIFRQLQEGHEWAPEGWQLEEQQRPWTADMRRRQAQVLDSVLPIERQAVDALGEALARADSK